MKLDPDAPHAISNGDTITLGTTLPPSSAGGQAHLPTRLEITFNNHTPPLLPPRASQCQPQQDTPPTKPAARNTFHAPSDSEEEGDITSAYKVETTPSAAVNDVFTGKGFIKTWRPFPPMKVPHNDGPLPPLIDLSSDIGGVWEPAPVVECIEISSDAEAVDGEESEEEEVHYRTPIAAKGLGEVPWDDEGTEQQKSRHHVGLPETVTVVPETQSPDQPPKVQEPEPVKVRTAPPFPHPVLSCFRCRETNVIAYGSGTGKG